MTLAFKVVIPARYSSTRLPGKPLIQLAGKPMIAHVCERAVQSGAEQIVVATDDQRIFDVVKNLGFEVTMTDKSHRSGTERITEVAQSYQWKQDDIIVNLQGDEPLLQGKYIQSVAKAVSETAKINIATLASEISNNNEIFNTNIVKVVLDKWGHALYFSRAPIPWNRIAFEKMDEKDISMNNLKGYLRHIGLYAYTVEFLDRYTAWAESDLENIELLEQLRILWYGEKIKVKRVTEAPPAGVDTREDVLRVEHLL